MSAKLLMGLSEENPELKKQIGCMTGIFQVFDRHHLITGRRLSVHSRKSLPSGQSHLNSTTCTEERCPGSPQIVLEYNPNKSSKENRRVSVDSSTSLPPLSSSSFSSLKCNKAIKPKSSDTETKSICNDFRDVVKDSINGETRPLSVKTSVKEKVKKDNVLKHRDSPRPIMSVDLNDSLQFLVRLKDAPWGISEAPRFSCDGREFSRSKSTTKLRELPRFSLDGREGSLRSSNFGPQPKEMDRSSLNRGIPSVVAKLMGLEAMPSSESQEELVKSSTKKSNDPFCVDSEKDLMMHSLKSSLGASETRRLKNSGPVSKHSSKQTESVYSQIERRVKELDFPQSNKDLRALKHILDTMQAKGILKSKESDDQQTKQTSQKNQNLKPVYSQSPQITKPGAFEAPIVIMKPAKSTKKSGDLEGLSGLRKLRTSQSASRKKANDQAPRASLADPLSEKQTAESSSQRIQNPVMQRSPRPQQLTRERSGSPVKTLNSSSPRVQQRKLDPEKKPRPSTRKQNANRNPLEPVLSNGNLRVKPSKEQLNKQQGTQADEISKRGNSNISLATQADAEVTGDDCRMIMSSPSYQLDNKKIQNEDSSSTDSTVVSVEQPSPISVLEAAFYQDDLPLSPVKKISFAVEADDDIQTSSEDCRSTLSKLSSEIHQQKLCFIKDLVKKLRQLSSTDDAKNQEADHDHMSQILLSAGLLSKDLTTGATQETIQCPKSNAERLQQDLMFDVVKEILVQKLELMSHGPQPGLFLRAKKVTGQYLLTEVCADIKQLLVKRQRNTSLEDEELTFREDLLRQSDGWEDLGMEVPGLVLEIERSIFKDLIAEIVTGEAHSGLQTKANRRSRQLFM